MQRFMTLIGKCVECGNSQHKWCKSCQINYLRKNFASWTSGNKRIGNFIQGIQLKINSPFDRVFEWIPYNQFNNIKKISDGFSYTTYSAVWKDGPLCYDQEKNKYTRKPGKTFVLKILNGSRDIVNELNKEYSYDIIINNICGISQNPDTKDYIMVLNNNCVKCCELYMYNTQYEWCRPCSINYLRKNFANWTSGNGRTDTFIREMQLEINSPFDRVFEWIPYNQFNNVRKTRDGTFYTMYSAVWKDGPLCYNQQENKYTRKPGKTFVLRFLNYSRDITDGFSYFSDKMYSDNIIINNICGISQNPDTKYYIIVLDNNCVKCGKFYNDKYKWCQSCNICYFKKNFINWTSENEKIDNFIQTMQLKINSPLDRVFEWIPYNQFNIKEIGKSLTIHSAIWEDGPLCYNQNEEKYKRKSNKVLILASYNSQDIDELLDVVEKYNDTTCLYGISQHPDKNYILVLHNKYDCVKCDEVYTRMQCQIKENFTDCASENEKIHDLIQEMQLKNKSSDIIFEWIPYNQFNYIKRIGKGGFATVYSATWKDGPFDRNFSGYTRNPDKTVALKCLDNSRNISNEFLNEIKAYSVNNFDNILKVYGISQNPSTKNYIMVLEYAEGRDFNYWINNNHRYFNWTNKLKVLSNIINGLQEIHQKGRVHGDLHVGNILFKEIFAFYSINIYISDMGLCGEVDNTNKANIYGVMPYVSPEVLRGKPYTQAADVYSFGMIMYFVATERQPFSDRAHDQYLALDVCEGIRPEINEPEAPKCYIELMEMCWDLNPANRLNATEIKVIIDSFHISQFNEAERYIKTNETKKNNQPTIHPQAIYTSRLLNPFTEDLPRYTGNTESECLDCVIRLASMKIIIMPYCFVRYLT